MPSPTERQPEEETLNFVSHLSASLAVLALAAAAEPTRLAATSPLTSPNVVAHEELVASGRTDLFEYVRLHRPHWLRTRGISTSGIFEVVVYVDGNRMGGPRALEQIRPDMTAELRYFDGREATTRWGTGHGAGVILVTTGPPVVARDRALDARGA